MMEGNVNEKKRVVELLTKLGKAYIEKGQYDEAIEKFNQLVLAGVKDTFVYLNLSKAYILKEQYDEKAINVFQKTLNFDPYNKVINVILSQIYLDEKREDDEAYHVYKNSLQFDPKNQKEIELALLNIEAKKGNHNNAKKLAEKRLNEHPDESDVLQIYIKACWQESNFIKVRDFIKNIMIEKKDNYELLNWYILNCVNAIKEKDDFNIEEDDIKYITKYLNSIKSFQLIDDIYLYIAAKRIIHNYELNQNNITNNETDDSNSVSEFELFLTDNSFSNIWDSALNNNGSSKPFFNFKQDIWNRIDTSNNHSITNDKNDDSFQKKSLILIQYSGISEDINNLFADELNNESKIELQKLTDGYLILSDNTIDATNSIIDILKKTQKVKSNGKACNLTAIIHQFQASDSEQMFNELDIVFNIQQLNSNLFNNNNKKDIDTKVIYLTDPAYNSIKFNNQINSKLSEKIRPPYFTKPISYYEIEWENPLEKLRNGFMKKINRLDILDELHLNDTFDSFKAIDTFLDRLVVLKVLRPDFPMSNGETVNNKFSKQANIIGKLHHPSFAKIYDINEGDGFSYITREYIEGKEISTPLTIFNKVHWLEAIRMCLKIGEGLKYAHKEGVVHAKINPSNIFITENNEIKITDFSIPNFNIPFKKLKNITLEKLCFLAPEQISNKNIDQRTDIYSLGLLLYQLLAQQNPFYDKNKNDVINNINSHEATPITSHVDDLPAEIDNIINKAISKFPENRYDNIDDMLENLKKITENVQ